MIGFGRKQIRRADDVAIHRHNTINVRQGCMNVNKSDCTPYVETLWRRSRTPNTQA